MLSERTRALIAAQRQLESRTREAVISDHGSTATFLDATPTERFDDPHSPLLEPFYHLYARCFPLAEEREPIEGFAQVLAFNRDRGVQAEYGPIHEFIAVKQSAATRKVVAAANFAVMPYSGADRAAFGFDGSCQLNFLCVEPELRGVGLAQRLLDDVDTTVRDTIAAATGASNPRFFVTIEQNNPHRMTSEQIEDDAAAALIDPLVRSRWWERRGYRKLDFAYVQPPLSPEHEACTYIDYFIRMPVSEAASASGISAAALREHLRRFFFVSVGKMQIDMATNPSWLAQSEELSQRGTVGIIKSPE